MRWLALLLVMTSLEAKLVRRLPTAWEDPWGTPKKTITQEKQSVVQRATTSAIRFHQKVISPVQGPRSGFYPTSSQYTLLAIRRYGFPKGFVLGCSRLMRENSDPWFYPTIQIGSSVRKQDMPY